MTADLSWLPDLVTLDQCFGDWGLYVDVIYGCFRREFVDSSPSLLGKEVRIRWAPMHDEKPDTFWHLVSEGTPEPDRLPALRRCERIRWPHALISEAHESDKVRIWTSASRGEPRVYLATTDFSYVAVFADRESYRLLITAFPVEYERKRNQFRKEFDVATDDTKANTTN